MLKKFISLLPKYVAGIRTSQPPRAATRPALPMTLEELAAVVLPSAHHEFRYVPGAVSLETARQATRTNIELHLSLLLENLKTSLATREREANYLRDIASSVVLGQPLRDALHAHRYGSAKE